MYVVHLVFLSKKRHLYKKKPPRCREGYWIRRKKDMGYNCNTPSFTTTTPSMVTVAWVTGKL